MKHSLNAVVLASLTLLSPLTLAQEEGSGLEVRRDPNNVVAGSLVGKWRLDEALNKRLGHEGGAPTIEFVSDETVLTKVPAALAKKLGESRIYLAGVVHRGDKGNAFLLTVHSGNPMVVWFRERNGVPLGDAESWNVSVVCAEGSRADLLFIGGDHDNQSFAAYTRVKKFVGNLEPAAALSEMARLLGAGKSLEFVETFCAPDDLAAMLEKGRTPEKLAQRFTGERAEIFVKVLEDASKQSPEMSDGGDTALWVLEKTPKTPGSLRLQRIDGRWYLRNN